MNKGELINVISERTGIQKNTVTLIVSEVHDTITRSLKSGDSVKIAGFGTFHVTDRQARQGRNPRTGEVVEIPAKSVPKFRAGKTLKSAIC